MANMYGKGAKGASTKLHSQIIRTLGYCEAAGWFKRKCSPALQCAHIIGRKSSHTRTDLRNAFCLCATHHALFTDNPREFSRFITDTWAQEHYDEVYTLSQSSSKLKYVKVDWEERRDFLKDILEQIESGELTLTEAREYERNYWS